MTRKTLQTAEELMVEMIEEGITKTDILAALGGGVVGDLTGFCASVFLRGMEFVQFPTSLLAAVDSSVGGKTAVDLSNGKNMVGAFHQPIAVFCDVATFETLPPETYSDGMAEVIKYGIIYDSDFFGQIERHEISDEDLVHRCVEIKAEVVAADEFDKGPRHILNFGHTLGHGIESVTSKDGMLHGECVALGMLPMCSAAVRARLLPVLEKLGLPVSCAGDPDQVMQAVIHDKKQYAGKIRSIFVETVGTYTEKELTPEELRQLYTGYFLS